MAPCRSGPTKWEIKALLSQTSYRITSVVAHLLLQIRKRELQTLQLTTIQRHGPLHVSYANYAQTFDSYLQPSFNEMGMPTTHDFNSRALNGIQCYTSTIDPANEMRASSQETFLTDAQSRSILKVYQLSAPRSKYCSIRVRKPQVSWSLQLVQRHVYYRPEERSSSALARSSRRRC